MLMCFRPTHTVSHDSYLICIGLTFEDRRFPFTLVAIDFPHPGRPALCKMSISAREVVEISKHYYSYALSE